jgi:hypothetical protein
MTRDMNNGALQVVRRRLYRAVRRLVGDRVGGSNRARCVCGVHVPGLVRIPGGAGTHRANQRRRPAGAGASDGSARER